MIRIVSATTRPRAYGPCERMHLLRKCCQEDGHETTLGAADRPLGSPGGSSGRRAWWQGARLLLMVAALLFPMADATHAGSLASLSERLERLERENRELRNEIEAIKAAQAAANVPGSTSESEKVPAGLVRTDSQFGYEILDPTDGINRKERLVLDRKRDGTLAPDGLYLQGAVTPIANYQSSNRADKFGYLMRHPTARNQVGKTVSEAAIHSVQLGVTATLGDWIVNRPCAGACTTTDASAPASQPTLHGSWRNAVGYSFRLAGLSPATLHQLAWRSK